MPTIIKAADHPSAAQGVAFDFDDMAARAGRYLDTVRAEAARIIAAAHQDAAAIRKQAEQEGRKIAESAVDQMVQHRVQEQLGQQLETLLPSLRQAIQDLHHARQAWLAHWEQSAVHVAAAIAARLIRQEISQKPEITLTLVREALELAAGSPHVRVHLNPSDYRALEGQLQMLTQELATLAVPEWIADPQITPGGCRVETRFGVIDQQFEAQLARIEEELT
jgi:flagellar assembly protein FliH